MDRIVGGAYSMEDEEVGGGPVGGKVVGGARVGGRVVGGARVGGRVVGGAKRKLGRMLGKMSDEDMTMLRDVVKMSDQELEGSGFYSAMGRSFVDRIRPLLGETGTTHPVVQGAGKAGEAEMNVVEMVGDGVTCGGRIGGGRIGGGRIGEVVKPLKMAKDLAFQVSGLRGKGRKVSDKMKKRGDLIKKLMKEKKLSLAEASKYIKEHKLM